ncbi:MAG: YbaN family protein [Bacteroidales bacterium]|nr:YbaN family protein [Bacteroidales bacterium]
MSRLKKGLLVVAGCLSLLLGLVGIPVPMLPTTPFLLLSAYLFARSSPRIYHWLLHHRYLGKFIRDYHEKKGVPLKVKTWALTLLWATILYSALWMIETLWIKLLLIAIATGVSVHILSLRTIK